MSLATPRIGRLGLLLAALTLLSACGGGGDDTTTLPTSLSPSDTDASDAARLELNYLQDLSNGTLPGVLAGQNTGHGDQILNSGGTVGYAPLMDTLAAETGERPAVVGLDYEYDRIFTPAQLANANQALIAHWQAGGLVTINWSPNNPW